MSIRGSAAACGLVLGCLGLSVGLTSSALGEVPDNQRLPANLNIWQANEVLERLDTAQLQQSIDAVARPRNAPSVAGTICNEPGANCQLPDQMGHGAGGITGATSDANPAAGFAVAENFTPASNGSVTGVCWWGFYRDFGAQADCGPGAGDAFTVTYYEDDNGVPGGVHAGPFAVSPAKGPTGLLIGIHTEFEYSAGHASVAVVAGTCYWIEIQNSTTTADCVWLWETAPPGDELSAQDADGDGYEYLTERNDFDLALCLDVALGDPTGLCELEINAACGPGAGLCNEPNGTPGCEDEICCSLTCAQDPFCCSGEWDDSCVQGANGIGCVFLGENCFEPPANCQYPDQMGHGAGGIVGATSDANPGFAVADNFVPEANSVISQVCWWGLYFDFGAGTDCGPGDGDAFTIQYYLDDNGVPGATHAGPFSVSPIKAATGQSAGGIAEYEFVATHANVGVAAGTCYWIEIQNSTTGDCFWLWETAPGDGLSAQDTDGGGYDYLSERSDYDLAFCLDVAVVDTTGGLGGLCELEINAACGEGAGLCEEPNGTPGCEDEICCSLTCAADPFCCSGEWDASCVAGADAIGCICIPGGGDEGVAVPASDDFDSYADGFTLVGVNGWGGWDDVAATIATVSSDQSLSAPHSVKIDLGDDQVQQYLDAECEGQWIYSIQQYVPSNMVGTSYFILLNTYADGGTKNWSTQVMFTATTGIVESDFEATQLSLITNQWVEIRVEIDLDANTQDILYGGNLLSSKSWTEGVSTGGAPAIRAVDLFANAATPVYYDDVSLSQEISACPWDCEPVPNQIVGTTDLLALLAAWGAGGPCDFDGGGVGTTDLLKLLASWGPCD